MKKLITLLMFVCALGLWNVQAQKTVTITLASSEISSGGYDSGAERVWTQDEISFGSKASMKGAGANAGSIQLQANNGVIYNTTPFPGRILSISTTQISNTNLSLCYGGTSRLVNSASANYVISEEATQVGGSSSVGWESSSFADTNYTYFAIKRATGAAYFTEIVITYETGSGPVQSSDATLKTLKVGDESILASGTYDYTYNLSEGITTLPTITYEKNHDKATIGTVTLPTIAGITDGTNNKAIIPLTAEDGTEKTYTITFSIVAELEPLTSLFETFASFTEGTMGAGAHSTDIATKLDTYTIDPGWTGEKIYQAGGAAKMGGSNALGWIQTPAIDLSGNEGKFTLTFDAMAWNGDATTLQVYLDDKLVHTAENMGNTTDYVMSPYSVVLSGGTASSKIKFEGAQASRGRFFLDNVQVTSGTVVVPVPVINITPTYISYNSVELNTPENKTATVTGVDLTDKISFEITGDGKDAFKVATTGWNDLTGGGFVITFTPTEAKDYTATIEVKSAGAVDNAIYLEGKGVAPIVDDESVIVRFNGYTQGNPPADGIFLAKGGNAANKGIATLSRDAAGTNYAVNQDGIATSQGWDGADETEKYWLVTFSTTGLDNLKLTSKQKGSNTGPKDFKIQYKVGDGTWTDIPDATITVANDEYVIGKIENLDLPAALNNQASVNLRWLCTSTARISGDAAVAAGGVNRLDVLITQGAAPILSDNNNLKSLTISSGTLSPAFDPEVITYSVVLPIAETVIPTVTYELEDEKATAVVTEATGLPGKTTVVVTSESGLKKTYTIAFRNASPAGIWKETWETGITKPSYTVGDYQGTACLWEVSGVISDTDENDKKNGTQSVRLRDPNANSATPHYIMMKEDKANGAGKITLYHGMYSTHTGGAYTLEVSNDGGATWAAYQAEVEEVPTTWSETTFTVNIKGNIRIRIVKATPQVTSSINIDDITITDYTGVNIDHVDNSAAVRVYVENNIVFVKNAESGAQISVYDITGKIIAKTTHTEVPVSAKGIYVVRVNNKAYKVINK